MNNKSHLVMTTDDSINEKGIEIQDFDKIVEKEKCMLCGLAFEHWRLTTIGIVCNNCYPNYKKIHNSLRTHWVIQINERIERLKLKV